MKCLFQSTQHQDLLELLGNSVIELSPRPRSLRTSSGDLRGGGCEHHDDHQPAERHRLQCQGHGLVQRWIQRGRVRQGQDL